MYNIEFTDKITLEIFKGKNKNVTLIILLIFAAFIVLVPVVAACMLAAKGEGIPFGFIITCVLSFLSSGYLVKLFLWNKYGKEVFIIQNNELCLYYDYKFFKDHYQKIQFESMQIYFDYNETLINAFLRSNESVEEGSSCICFDIDGKSIKSKGEIPIETIIDFSKKIQDYRK